MRLIGVVDALIYIWKLLLERAGLKKSQRDAIEDAMRVVTIMFFDHASDINGVDIVRGILTEESPSVTGVPFREISLIAILNAVQTTNN